MKTVDSRFNPLNFSSEGILKLGSTEEVLVLVSAGLGLTEVVEPPGYWDGGTYLLDGPLRPPPLKSIISLLLEEDSVTDLSPEPECNGAPLVIDVELKGSTGPQEVSASFFWAKNCHATKRKRMKKNTGLVHSIVLNSALKTGRLALYMHIATPKTKNNKLFMVTG